MEINGQVITLIIFVVIGGIQWLLKKVKGQERNFDASESLEDIYEEFREEIRQRQTTVQQAGPPPMPEPISVSTPTPSAPQPTYQEEVPHIAPTQIDKPEITPEQQIAIERFEQLSSKKRRKKSSGTFSARDLLRNPQSARQAVILQEIFAKPRSMQN